MDSSGSFFDFFLVLYQNHLKIEVTSNKVLKMGDRGWLIHFLEFSGKSRRNDDQCNNYSV